MTRKKRPKENETLGISFLDMSDSESASIQKSDSKVENDDSATECFTVGIPLKYTARRKPSPIKKSSRNNQRYKARKGGNCKITGICTSTLVTVDDVIEDDTCQVGSVNHSDDFEDLIDKIGHQEDVKIQVKEKTDVVNEGNMSVLDDIFSSSDKSKQKRRRPPQKHRKSKIEHLDNESLIETSVTEDEKDPLGNTSTLKNDGIDVFSDPVKWKSRKRQQKERVSLVDQMVSDAADDYDDLFKSGKMKKMKKSNKLKPDSEDVPSYDPSGSLF